MFSGFSRYGFATNIKSYAVFSTSSYKSKDPPSLAEDSLLGMVPRPPCKRYSDRTR